MFLVFAPFVCLFGYVICRIFAEISRTVSAQLLGVILISAFFLIGLSWNLGPMRFCGILFTVLGCMCPLRLALWRRWRTTNGSSYWGELVAGSLISTWGFIAFGSSSFR